MSPAYYFNCWLALLCCQLELVSPDWKQKTGEGELRTPSAPVQRLGQVELENSNNSMWRNPMTVVVFEGKNPPTLLCVWFFIVNWNYSCNVQLLESCIISTLFYPIQFGPFKISEGHKKRRTETKPLYNIGSNLPGKPRILFDDEIKTTFTEWRLKPV